jgi:hypothetical protein
LLMIPRMGFLVVFGWCEVITILVPTRAFTKVDLPVLGRPTIATKPALKSLIRDILSPF